MVEAKQAIKLRQ